jgi:predicted kinase
MANLTVVVVSGRCATGKTYISKVIASTLGFMWISKDEWKEILFNALDPCCEEMNLATRADKPSYRTMERIVELALEAGCSVVVETDEFPGHGLRGIIEANQARCVQVFLYSDAEVLIERFTTRANSPRRNPLHCDGDGIEHFIATVRHDARGAPLSLPGPIIEVDTSYIEHIDPVALARRVASAARISRGARRPTKLSGTGPWGIPTGRLIFSLN